MSQKNQSQKKRRVATIGGTFDALHRGHQEYIKAAFEKADRVIIYVSTNEYLQQRKTKNYQVKLYEERYEQLKSFVKQLGCENRCEIRPHNKEDDFSVAYLNEFTRPDTEYMALVSPEYYERFSKIDQLRKAKGLPSIELVKQPRFRDENNTELSSGAIR
jgi:pantetheine-phosphate adenylyltransferase